MRGLLVSTALLAFLGVPATSFAAETYVCWSETVRNEVTDYLETKTVCRIGGSRTMRSFEDDVSVPVRLNPNMGTDAVGTCWYRTTAGTNWVLLAVYPDLSADLGYDPDGIPGGPIALDAAGERRCTSEPMEVPPPIEEAYDLLTSYDHPKPAPAIDPLPPRGLAGLDTYIGLTPPPAWADSLTSPLSGLFIEVETWVDGVEIDWGDGTDPTVIPQELFPLLTGYPDGIEPHLYETKTCPEPGGPKCHPTLAAYPLTVAYIWQARYRVDGDAWQTLVVDPTATTVDYPVAEIVSVLDGTG